MVDKNKKIRQMNLGPLIVPGLLVVFCIWYVFLILELPQGPGAEGPLGPSFVPWAWVSLLILFAFAEIGFHFVRSSKNLTEKLFTQKDLIDVLILTVFLVGFSMGIQYVGFSIATAVFLAISIWWGGLRTWRIVILYAIGFSIGINYIFHHILKVPLPQEWFF